MFQLHEFNQTRRVVLVEDNLEIFSKAGARRSHRCFESPQDVLVVATKSFDPWFVVILSIPYSI